VEPLLVALAVVVMLVGLIGVVVPVLPGLVLIWVAAVSTTLLLRADVVGWLVTMLLTVLFGLGMAATIWLPARQGRRGGVPLRSLLAAAAGAVVGFFVIPVIGFLVAGAAGLLLSERSRLDAWQPALRSVGGVVRAYGLGVVVELVAGLSMIAVWASAVLLR
jgi:uncharacterized protein YqgC (DUF456 family)